ncbi:MAG: hypothetical protein MJE77_23570 [Proteobacteria bacterium]|nr:hypothetical protein [Pseudomonadota bacterium]
MTESIPRSLFVCTVLTGLVSTGAAFAEPAVTLDITSKCPTDEQVRAALATHVDVVERGAPGAWTVSLSELDHVTHLSIRDTRGEVSVVRSITSADCQAVAEACAIIVHAHFAGLERAEHIGATTGPSLQPITIDVPPPVRKSAAAPVRTSVASAESSAREVDIAVTAQGETASARPSWLAVVLSGGFDMAIADTALVRGIGRFDLSWVRRNGIVMSGGISVSTLAGAAEPSSVRQRQLAARTELGYRISRDVIWLEPAVSASLVVSRVTAEIANADHSATRVHPMVGTGLAGGFRIGRRAWLRAAIELSLFLSSDRYLAESTREIARSPRFSAAFLGGIEWRL